MYGIFKLLNISYKNRMESLEKEVFNAFQGGFGCPSYFYYINKVENGYKFRYGYSRSGIFIANESNTTDLNDKVFDERYYNEFISALLGLTEEWKEEYRKQGVLDGTQWHINFLEIDKKYEGSNDFPTNYEMVMNTIRKYFDVEPGTEEKKFDDLKKLVESSYEKNLSIDSLDDLFKED